jgi:APA family basic amino acid/polyamine antiporter
MTQNQKIGFWPLASLVTGNLVGSGVLLLPSSLAKFGSISLFAWGITALGAIVLALIFAELSHKIPKNGGPYAFVSAAFGKNYGYVIAWGYWTFSWLSNSALIATVASYFSLIAGGLSKPFILTLEIGLIILITAFNMLGIRTTGRAELIITVTKIIPLLLIPIIGVFVIKLDNFPALNLTDQPNYLALNSVAFITLWAFVGLESGTVPGGQVINARRTIPLATITGTLIASFVYVLGTIVAFGVIPNEELAGSHAPYAEAASVIFGGSWAIAIAIAAIVICVGSLNGWTIVVGRIAQAAANDGLFPKLFSRTNEVGTPTWAILVSSILTIPFVIISLDDGLLDQFNFVIDISVTFILLVYLTSILAFFKLTHKDRDLRIYKHIIGILGLAFVIWALCATKPVMLFYSLLIAVSGLPLWVYMRIRTRNINVP